MREPRLRPWDIRAHFYRLPGADTTVYPIESVHAKIGLCCKLDELSMLPDSRAGDIEAVQAALALAGPGGLGGDGEGTTAHDRRVRARPSQ